MKYFFFYLLTIVASASGVPTSRDDPKDASQGSFASSLRLNESASGGQDEVYFIQTAEDYFLLGMRQYAQREYKSALTSFQTSLRIYPNNHRATASTIMTAKSHYAMKNYADAAAVCDSFIARYPNSSYIEDALFTRGMCYYNEGRYAAAFHEMQRVYGIAQQRLNKEHSFKVADHIATEFLPEQEIETFIRSPIDAVIRSLVTVVLAEKYFIGGNIERSKAVIENVHDPTDDGLIKLRINRLLARIERGNVVKIGVLLPLHKLSTTDTREKKVALEALEGIQLAVSDYEDGAKGARQITIELDVKDSERKRPVIDSIITLWNDDSRVIGIVGPLFSDETAEAAEIAQEKNIPIVSPTATDEGIAEKGEFVFQANSTNSMRGKVMAQFAVNMLGVKNVAVLASNAPSSHVQADSFAAEITRLGARVVIDRRYNRGETDLRNHLREIRSAAASLTADYTVTFKGKINVTEVTRRLVSLGVRLSTIDSVIEKDGSLNLTKLFGEKAPEIAESLKLPVKKVTPHADSLQYPISSIDAIFCPISMSQQIGVISSQIAYFNLKMKILGTSDWYNINELEMNRLYADGVIFGSDRWIEEGERTTSVFSRYAGKFGKQMSDNALFGYDVMSMVIGQLNDGAITREQLANALSKIVHFHGVRNDITLAAGRVNGTLNMLQYKDGSISKLRTYTYQK